MRIQLGDGTSAEITSIKNIDLDEHVVYFEGERLTEARAAAIARDIAARHGRKAVDRGWPPRRAGSGSGFAAYSTTASNQPRMLRDERVRSELAREAIDHYLAKGA